MGLLKWLFGTSDAAGNVLVIKDWILAGGVKLPRSVRTPGGGKVKCLDCCVDIHYRIRNKSVEVVKVRLATSAHVSSTHTGEAWQADSSLRRLLNNEILPRDIGELIEQDDHLQRIMHGKAKGQRGRSKGR